MTTYDKLTSSQKIRAALHRDVRAISSETCHFLGLEVTKSAMEVVAELVYKKISLYGTDLEAFAKHAKRSTINSDDVKLLARRNPSLLAHLNSKMPAMTTTGQKRRKTGVKPQETPAEPAESKERGNSNQNKEETVAIANKETVEKTEEVVLEDTRILDDKDDFLENMIVDEIDLTFD